MSTVIKAGEAGTVLRRLSTVDLADHLSEVRSLLEDARARAARIVAGAKEERTRLLGDAEQVGHDAGYRAGYEEGLRAGRDAAYADAVQKFRTDHAHVTADLKRVIDEIDRTKRDLTIAAEHKVLDLSLRVAAKLTLAIGRADREAASANLRRALDLVTAGMDVTVRAHPSDIAALKTFTESIWQRFEGSSAVRLVSDDNVSPGGCLVRSGPCEIDATLETQVDEIAHLLLGEEYRLPHTEAESQPARWEHEARPPNPEREGGT